MDSFTLIVSHLKYSLLSYPHDHTAVIFIIWFFGNLVGLLMTTLPCVSADFSISTLCLAHTAPFNIG